MITLLFQKIKYILWGRIRWLPVLMFSTLMMLGVRFHQMGQKLSDWLQPSLSLYGSSVKAASTPEGQSPSTSKDLETVKTRPMEKLASPPNASPEKESSSSLSSKETNKFDLLNLTPQEFEIIQRIVTERKMLEKKKDRRHLNQIKMEILNKSIDLKITQLKKLKEDLEAKVSKQEKKRTENLLELVKMYETMKPQEAAQIFSTLNLEVTLSIFRQMKGKKASAILASLPPEQAGQITYALAQENEQMKEIGQI